MREKLMKTLTSLKAHFGFWEERLLRQRTRRKLRLRESLSLGEKRFLAVVEYGHQEILLAGTSSTITLLASASHLDGSITLGDGRVSKDCLQ